MKACAVILAALIAGAQAKIVRYSLTTAWHRYCDIDNTSIIPETGAYSYIRFEQALQGSGLLNFNSPNHVDDLTQWTIKDPSNPQNVVSGADAFEQSCRQFGGKFSLVKTA
ncbi:hypothetical protein BCV70DRAFT_232784 [Testicularia cyperi]|uniref:Uncharacterized protein n=1 Tax=Testicularia cyperi TaxID=1882483 RepID=A0A317XMY5_9BASI|nr:hypothetical protein BCV70DRAFT_232784 [Testicularia cyperi]